MAITEAPVTYHTSDGKTFTSKADAERHERLSSARAAYMTAREAYGKALAEMVKTADGEPFSIKYSARYFIHDFGFDGLPRLEKIFLYGASYDVDPADESVTIIHSESDRHEVKYRRYRIGSLYQNERAAELKLLEMQEERLKHLDEMVEPLRKRFNQVPS